MTIYDVSSASALNTAVSFATSGDEIVLSSGVSYGNITINNKNCDTANPLVIRNAATRVYGTNPTATFDTLTIGPSSTNGITIRGVQAGTINVYGNNCTIEYCRITGIVRCGDVSPYYPRSGATVRYCEFYQSRVQLDHHTNYNFYENFIHKKQSDHILSRGASSGNVLNNFCFDALTYTPNSNPHYDFYQSYEHNGVSPDNVTIRGNIFIDDPSTDIEITGGGIGQSQGIFCGGPTGNGSENVHIEQNMVWCQNSNGIKLESPFGTAYIKSNTVMGGGNIICNTYGDNTYSTPIEDNIVSQISTSGPVAASLSGNLTGSVSTHLEDPTNDLDWTMFIPKAAYATKGAATRLAEIVAGTNVEALVMANAIYPAYFTAPGEGVAPPSISGLTINLASA